MDDRSGSKIVSDPTPSKPGSKTKTAGEKRVVHNSEKECGGDFKRMRLRDFRSTGSEGNFGSSGAVRLSSGSLDLNTEIGIAKSSFSGNLEIAINSQKAHMLREDNSNHVTTRGIDLDLNVEDVSSSLNLEIDNSFKNHDELKSHDASECASSCGPLREKDPLKIWKEMKQNGFLSSTHGGIPAPKQRGRRSKNDVLKKKMEIARREKKLELAKKEQVDRFMKFAAPSGLLNELNPGIINHVRNKKQVHSIIEAIVRSEKQEKERLEGKHSTENRHGSKASTTKDLENTNDSDTNTLSYSQGYGPSYNFSASRQLRGCSLTMARSSLLTVGEGVDSKPILLDKATGKNYASQSNTVNNKETLALELSSSHVVTENACLVSNNEGENLTCISSLTLKAATVASQWLELVHQDIKGRLSALRRSKKRVRAVISTELPFLISKELLSNEENKPLDGKSISDGTSRIPSADVHHARWAKLFDQMDRVLAEEEKHLESWLNQVKEMQMHCDQGLNHVQSSAIFGLQHPGETDNDSRTMEMNQSESELAVGAAAASIYSTCSFLLSKNVSCL